VKKLSFIFIPFLLFVFLVGCEKSKQENFKNGKVKVSVTYYKDSARVYFTGDYYENYKLKLKDSNVIVYKANDKCAKYTCTSHIYYKEIPSQSLKGIITKENNKQLFFTIDKSSVKKETKDIKISQNEKELKDLPNGEYSVTVKNGKVTKIYKKNNAK
jgi:hypothetical protein